MRRHEDFLLEIHTEELPPKSLTALGAALLAAMEKQLQKAQLAFAGGQYYVTPRRLALLMTAVASQQAATTVERKGPAFSAAYDAAGKPTAACLGFARSCGVAPDALITLTTPQGEWVGYREQVAGKTTLSLLAEMIQQVVTSLPIAKRMRWGTQTENFIRPVHAILAVFGKDVVELKLWGCHSDRFTYGHRFHYPKSIKIAQPRAYAQLLREKGYVIADFAERQALIRSSAQQVVNNQLGSEAQVLFDEQLLHEVTGLVEWPVAICGRFADDFLKLPAPVLIAALQDHQRYFPIADANGQLLPYFAALINIESRDLARVILGNERVLQARLADAAFFFETDKKIKLAERVADLKGIVFQAKLGTVYDKSQRLITLTGYLATLFKNVDRELIQRAALLAKADLTTGMVGEFPELQGVMGRYYALHDQEDPQVAQALEDHYKPRFATDDLPHTLVGCLLAIAERCDTLMGLFGIHHLPSGDKDPYGLRRAALGIIKIVLDKALDVHLMPLLAQAFAAYPQLENNDAVSQVFNFITERLKGWCQEQGIEPDVIAAVMAPQAQREPNDNLFDLYQRLRAVQNFKALSEAQALTMANKRVSNILAQAPDITASQLESSLFEYPEEENLAALLKTTQQQLEPLYQRRDYQQVMMLLAHLRTPIDAFFDRVMVMVDDNPKRNNRLLLLKALRGLFAQIADIALLSTGSV